MTDTKISVVDAVKALQVALIEQYGLPIHSGSWNDTKTPLADRVAFAKGYKTFSDAVARLNSTFTATVWSGWADGSLPTTVEGTRKPRSEDSATPGRKAVPKSVAEILGFE